MVAKMLNDGKFTHYQRLSILFGGSFIVAFLLIGGLLFILSTFFSQPVIRPMTQPFKVCTKTVKAGEALQYKVHYYKRLDIPGDLTKQLVGTGTDGEAILIPAEETAGHLHIGETKATGFVVIPIYTPPGTYYLKLSATYNLGWRIDRDISITEKFEVVK